MSVNPRGSMTTTDSLAGRKLLLCHQCRERKPLLVMRENHRQVCIDCLPADERKVFEQPAEADQSE